MTPRVKPANSALALISRHTAMYLRIIFSSVLLIDSPSSLPEPAIKLSVHEISKPASQMLCRRMACATRICVISGVTSGKKELASDNDCLRSHKRQCSFWSFVGRKIFLGCNTSQTCLQPLPEVCKSFLDTGKFPVHMTKRTGHGEISAH